MSTTDEKKAFAARLNEVCGDMDMPLHGRQTALAKQFEVVPTAARKWLHGVSYPEIAILSAIAKWANVNFEWLMTGRGPKHGNLIETKGVVLDEALRSLPADERKQALDFIRYKLEKSSAPFVGERLARYVTALEAFDQAVPDKKPKH